MAKNLEKRLIAIDGKRLRGATHNLVHYVSAYECNHGLLLGQVKTEVKSNEITAIPELLKIIDVRDAVVTIDAAGCQKAIVNDIIDRGGDYIIALKGNQSTLLSEAENFFEQARAVEYDGVPCDRVTTIEKGHGRIESREITVTDDLDWLECRDRWKNLKTLIEIKSDRMIQEKKTSENRYYISSKNMTAKETGKNIRAHWGIENQLHWVLDVIFNDDFVRANMGQAAENLGLFRRMAFCLLKQDVGVKSMASKRRIATWEETYVFQLLGNFVKKIATEGEFTEKI